MAKQNTPQISARKDTITVIADINGNPILEIGLHEYTIRHPNGAHTHRRLTESIQLVCGTVWNPSLMLATPPVHVGVCEFCHRPSLSRHRTHGLVAMHRARLCVDGGELCCPSHRRLGRDRKWRCPKHHRAHLLKSLFRPIFFEQEE